MDDGGTRRQAEKMDTLSIQVMASVLAVVLILFLISSLAIIRRRRKTGRFSRHIVATITQVQVEAGGLSSWWVVTAQWFDPRTGQTISFRSSHLTFPPRQHVGEAIAVDVDPNNPARYRMEL